MSRYNTPNDLLWAIAAPELRRVAPDLTRTREQVDADLRVKGHDLQALDRAIIKMIDDLPRHIGMRAMADALAPPRAKHPCLLSSGLPEADAVLARVPPDDWTTWSGDESIVGIVVTVFEEAFLYWFSREYVIRHHLERLGQPAEEMKRPHVQGKLTVLVGGKDAILHVDLDADVIRTLDLLTVPAAPDAIC